jgi:hypothetical protein
MVARVYVDFNEMPTADEVLLAQGDAKPRADGEVVRLCEGLELGVYSDDVNEMGERDDLVADGVVMRNTHGSWTSAARWVLKIDGRGIRHESDER